MNRRSRAILLLLPVLAASMSAGCGSRPTYANAVTKWVAASHCRHICAGDVLEISVQGHKDLTLKLTVDPNGRILSVTPVQVSGKTPMELKEVIAKRLAKHLKSPEVFIRFAESADNFVTVSGQVPRPGRYRPGPETRLLDVITFARGDQDLRASSWARASLLRHDSRIKIDFEKLLKLKPATAAERAANNPRLLPGHKITIPPLKGQRGPLASYYFLQRLPRGKCSGCPPSPTVPAVGRCCLCDAEIYSASHALCDICARKHARCRWCGRRLTRAARRKLLEGEANYGSSK